MNNSKSKENTESMIYAAPIFEREIETLSKMAKNAKVKFITSQIGCPLGMQGIYFEFSNSEEKSRFVADINRIVKPVTVWAS